MPPASNTSPAPAESAGASTVSGLSQLKIDRGTLAPARRRRGWLPWVLGAVVIAAGAGFFLMPHPLEVKTASVVQSAPSQQYVQLTASGYVVAQRRAAVASKATGRLVELNVREGSVVKRGEVLAKLDSSDVQAAILAAQAGVLQAEAQVRQAEVEQVNAQAELARTEGLQAQNFVSPQAVDTAKTRANAARASVSAAQAAVAQARANLKVQQVNQDYTDIRAPFDGVVLVKNANVGDIITPFSNAAGSQGAVLTMADMGTLEVEADVSEGNLSKARTGQPVEITLDALPERRFRGKVIGLVPTVDRAKATVMTKIQFEKLDPAILPEMSAKVAFLSQAVTDAEQQPVLAVAPQAIARREGREVVFRVRKDDKGRDIAEAVPVQPGRTLGELRELSGLRPGDGKAALKSGDKVVADPPEKLKSGGLVALSAS